MLRLLVIGLLLLRLTPLGGEAVEAWVDVAGADDHSHDAAPDAEHGCAALVHHCGCHSVAGSIRETAFASAPPTILASSDFVLSRPRAAPDARVLLRPPTA